MTNALSTDVATVNARHRIAGVLEFHEGPGGLTCARIANAQATAALTLQGAQLTAWQPRGQDQPVLWLSAAARYLAGKPIRGGIPICWPWFGAPAPAAATASTDAPATTPAGLPTAGPAHGFARNLPWSVDSAQALVDGATRIVLGLADSPASHTLWPWPFGLTLTVTVGSTLALELATHNTGTTAFTITEALHTYFHIGDIGSAAVEGLEGAAYFDAVGGAVVPGHAAPVRFAQEVDRVYDSSAACVIDDPVLRRRIRIAKSGSGTTVIWNPWDAKAERLGDLGAGDPVAGTATPAGWRRMVCVESGNARGRHVTVAPGARHVLAVRYSVDPVTPKTAVRKT